MIKKIISILLAISILYFVGLGIYIFYMSTSDGTVNQSIDFLQIGAWLFIVLVIIGIFVVVFLGTKRHNDFIKKSQLVEIGMTVDDVLSIMGCSATTTEKEQNKRICIWEKNQWRGVLRGGTLTRAVKITFISSRVVSVVTKNFDKSTF